MSNKQGEKDMNEALKNSKSISSNVKAAPTKTPIPEPISEIVEPYWPLRAGNSIDLRELIQENLGSRGIQPFDLPRIRVATGGSMAWVVEGSDDPVRDVEGILLAWRMQRNFWKQGMESGGRRPPDCISHNLFNGVGDPGGLCNQCPNSEWGSALQGRAQACKEVCLMLVQRPDERFPRLLIVPRTSLEARRQYAMQLLNRELRHWQLVTKLRLEKIQNEAGIAYGVIQFSMGRVFKPEERERLRLFQTEMKKILYPDAIDARPLLGQSQVNPLPMLEGPEIPMTAEELAAFGEK
jgi:hypothetical protein